MESLIAMTLIVCLVVAGATVLVVLENRRLRGENTLLWDLLHRHVAGKPPPLIDDGFLDPLTDAEVDEWYRSDEPYPSKTKD